MSEANHKVPTPDTPSILPKRPGRFARMWAILREGRLARRSVRQLRRQGDKDARAAERIRARQQELVVELGEDLVAKGRQDRFGDLRAKLEQVENERRDAEAALEQLLARKNAATQALREINERLGKVVTALEKEHAAKAAKAAQLTRDLAAVEKLLKRKTSERDQMELKLARARKTPVPEGKVSPVPELEIRLAGLNKEREELLRRCEQARSELPAAEAAAKDAKEQLDAGRAEMARELEPHRSELADVEEKIPVSRRRIEALRAERAALIFDLGTAALQESWEDPELQEKVEEHRANAAELDRFAESAKQRQQRLEALGPAVERSRLLMWALVSTFLLAVVIALFVTSLLCGWGVRPPAAPVEPPARPECGSPGRTSLPGAAGPRTTAPAAKPSVAPTSSPGGAPERSPTER